MGQKLVVSAAHVHCLTAPIYYVYTVLGGYVGKAIFLAATDSMCTVCFFDDLTDVL